MIQAPSLSSCIMQPLCVTRHSQGSIPNTFLKAAFICHCFKSWTATGSSDKYHECNTKKMGSLYTQASLHAETSSTTGTLAPGASATLRYKRHCTTLYSTTSATETLQLHLHYIQPYTSATGCTSLQDTSQAPTLAPTHNLGCDRNSAK